MRASGSRRRGYSAGNAGLSMMEVIIALAMLSAGLLAMLAMQLHAMHAGRHGKNVTEAAAIGEQQLEFLYRQPWAALPPSPWSAPIPFLGAINGNVAGGQAIAQTYNVQWRVVADPDPNLRRVDVQVTWVEPDDGPNQPPNLYAVSTVRHNDP